MGQQNSSEQRLSPFHPSQLCQTCQTLFSGHREVDGMYPHIERLCKLRENVSNGCAFCAWIYSNLKSQSGVPPDPIDLKFRFSSDSRGARRQYPIIYGYVRERHLGSLRFALIPFKGELNEFFAEHVLMFWDQTYIIWYHSRAMRSRPRQLQLRVGVLPAHGCKLASGIMPPADLSSELAFGTLADS